MTAYGQRLRLRLFLEGIEVPIVAANVQTAPNSPIVCSIQIPPLAEGTRFLPRTLVHVFFLDMYEQKSPLVRKGMGGRSEQSPSRHEKTLQGFDPLAYRNEVPSDVQQALVNAESDLNNDRYKCLFVGEVIGFQWTKAQSQRSLVLQCADLSNYWDYAYQWSNTGIFGPGIKAVFSGGATNLFTDFLSNKGEVLTRLASAGGCNTYPKMKGLSAGIIRLLEAIGGVYQVRGNGGSVKKIAGQNIFFSLAELRLHLTQMIGAIEEDPTSSRILARQGYSGLFSRLLGGLGGQTSFRQAVNALSGIIFHEMYAQPCPRYVPGKDNAVSGSARKKLSDDPTLAPLAVLGENAAKSLGDIIGTLQSDLTAPEVVAIGSESLRITLRGRVGSVRTAINRAQATTASRRAPAGAKSLLSQAATALGKALTQLNRWSLATPSAEQSRLVDSLSTAQGHLLRLAQYTVPTTVAGQQEPARLMQQVFRPDIWFGAPPRCNVLFPEDYDQIVYQRMWLQEPTRFLLKTNDEFFGEDFLFDKFYFAPQGRSLKQDQTNLRDVLRNDLLDHELFTGILPVFEKMGEFNVFAARSGTQQNPTKVGFAQRSTNFLYFKHRFNARQMRVAGKFNPYIACGCPGLIIDKYVDAEVIAAHNELAEKRGFPTTERLQLLGTHFLGNFTQVSHAVSQAEERGRTEINISYPRQLDETVEFLGTFEASTSAYKKQDQAALRATDIAALSAPAVGSLGPKGGIITTVTDVTLQYIREANSGSAAANREGTARLPLFGRRRKTVADTTQFKVPLVPVGVPTSASALGSTDVEAIVGDRDRDVVFNAYRVEEEVPRYRQEQVDLPMEEYLRPGWYGDVWSSAKIGEAYNTLFGIGAITDPHTISDPTGASLSGFSEAAQKAQDEAAAAAAGDDPRRDAPVLLQLEEGSSIEQAAEFLVMTYSYVRQQRLDVDEFIRAYTWRPIATMVDMLGTSDLVFNSDGSAVLSGIEGFHSRAFGPYDDLFGLVGPDIENVLGIKRGSTVAQRGDTRGRKQRQVQAYLSALLFSRGLLG